MRSKTFRALIESEDGGRSVFFVVPFDLKAEFGKARPPVVVRVGEFTFRSTVAVYSGRALVGLRRDRREAARVRAGERVEVTLALDEQPREVVPPPELAALLAKDVDLRERWETLSCTRRREHAEAIAGAPGPGSPSPAFDA